MVFKYFLSITGQSEPWERINMNQSHISCVAFCDCIITVIIVIYDKIIGVVRCHKTVSTLTFVNPMRSSLSP